MRMALLGGRFGYFLYFSARGGKGESKAPGGGGVGVFIENSRGGVSRSGGVEGPGGCLRRIGGFGGGGG